MSAQGQSAFYLFFQNSKPAACRLFDQYVKSAIESSVADQATILVPLQASLLPLHAV